MGRHHVLNWVRDHLCPGLSWVDPVRRECAICAKGSTVNVLSMVHVTTSGQLKIVNARGGDITNAKTANQGLVVE